MSAAFIALAASVVAIAAIAVSLYAKRLRRALGRDETDALGADRP